MTRKNRFRALRNLIVAAVLLLATWLISGAPLPTRTMRMHREERECLLPRSEIVWRTHFDDNRNDTLVGVTPTAVHTYRWGVEVWTRDPDRPTLVPLPSYGVGRTYGLLAVDPPAGAESARLTVTLETQYYVEDNVEGALYSEEYQEESVRDGACFFFQLTEHHPNKEEDPLWGAEYTLLYGWERNYLESNYDEERYFAAPYTLEFFDGEGKLILSCGNQT